MHQLDRTLGSGRLFPARAVGEPVRTHSAHQQRDAYGAGLNPLGNDPASGVPQRATTLLALAGQLHFPQWQHCVAGRCTDRDGRRCRITERRDAGFGLSRKPRRRILLDGGRQPARLLRVELKPSASRDCLMVRTMRQRVCQRDRHCHMGLRGQRRDCLRGFFRRWTTAWPLGVPFC